MVKTISIQVFKERVQVKENIVISQKKKCHIIVVRCDQEAIKWDFRNWQ
jgi:hypothetical protein